MKRGVGATAAITVLLAAWGSAAALAADAGRPYLGTWGARMSKAQMINAGLDPRMAGTFRIVLRKDGTYKSYNSLDRWSSGTFTASGNRIVFANDVLCKAGGFDFKGVYTWAIAKRTLRLTPLDRPGISGDPCGGRWQTLTYPVTWNRR